MITVEDIINFFQEYWGYLLLGISGVSVLGVGVYYLFFDNQPQPVVSQQDVSKIKNFPRKQLKKDKQIFLIDNENTFYLCWALFFLPVLLFLATRKDAYWLKDTERQCYYDHHSHLNLFAEQNLEGAVRLTIIVFICLIIGFLSVLTLPALLAKVFGHLETNFWTLVLVNFKNFLTIRNGSIARWFFIPFVILIVVVIVFLQEEFNLFLFDDKETIRKKIIDDIIRQYNSNIDNILGKDNGANDCGALLSFAGPGNVILNHKTQDDDDFLGLKSFARKIDYKHNPLNLKFEIKDELDPNFIKIDVVCDTSLNVPIFLRFLNNKIEKINNEGELENLNTNIVPNTFGKQLIIDLINVRFKGIVDKDSFEEFKVFVESIKKFFYSNNNGPSDLEKILKSIFLKGVINNSYSEQNIEELINSIKIERICDFLDIKKDEEYEYFLTSFTRRLLDKFRGELSGVKLGEGGVPLMNSSYIDILSFLDRLDAGEFNNAGFQKTNMQVFSANYNAGVLIKDIETILLVSPIKDYFLK